MLSGIFCRYCYDRHSTSLSSYIQRRTVNFCIIITIINVIIIVIFVIIFIVVLVVVMIVVVVIVIIIIPTVPSHSEDTVSQQSSVVAD